VYKTRTKGDHFLRMTLRVTEWAVAAKRLGLIADTDSYTVSSLALLVLLLD
jgi:hypothetical protein